MKSLRYGGTMAALLLVLVAGGCSSFNASSNEYAMRNEEAMQRQQLELDKPALDGGFNR